MTMPPTLLLDVDGTLAPFNQHAGTLVVTDLLVKQLGNKGTKIGTEFGNLYKVFSSLHHGKVEPEDVALKDKLNSYEVRLPPELKGRSENLMWSRELWLKYLSEKHRIGLSGEKIMEIIDAYWEAISISSQMYPDGMEYLKNLKSNRFLITASDHRLILKNNSIIYDPKASEQKKAKRVLEQGLAKFFKPDQIITGDPFNKPSVQFWQKCMKAAKLTSPDKCVVVDDSKAVITSAVNFGFKGYILDRAGHYSKEEVENQELGYLTELSQLRI